MAQEATEPLGIAGDWDRMYVDGEWRSAPDRDRVGVSTGGWSVDELAEHFREDVAGDVELTRTDSYF